MNIRQGNVSAISSRRADLDWLRVIAFGVLIYFHAAVAFTPKALPMIVNSESSLLLSAFVAFSHQFRLALLFLVSGLGVYFALRQRSAGAFLRERSSRLLIPALFGIAVLVPPMVYLEKRYLGVEHAGLLSFYSRLFTEGIYPSGNLSWHHFWFIVYLWLFCVAGWPVLQWLRSGRGQQWILRWGCWLSVGVRLYWPILPLLAVEVPLRALFPGFRDLIHDWASFTQWFLVFIAGYVFASHEQLLDRTQQLRSGTLLLALVASGFLFARYWSLEQGMTPVADGTVAIGEYLLFCIVRIANLWFWLLACLGYAGRYLNRDSAVLRYLNRAVYPLFCCHLTLLVAAEYCVLPLPWSISTKFLVITTAVVAVNLLLYEFLIRRVAWLRPLFGLKPAETGQG